MQCLLCEGIFSETLVPFMLSCGHTVCCDCVVKIQKEGFPCPHCVRPFQSFCLNLTLISKPKEIFCDFCVDDGEDHSPTFKCVECSKCLCDFAAEFHRRAKDSRFHKLLPISDLASEDQEQVVLPLLSPKRCLAHNQPYTHYNESIPGSHLLCVYCATEKGHLFSISPSLPLTTVSLSEQKVQQARAFSSKISERITSLSSASQTISDKIKSLNESRDLALSQIEQTFQTYRQALDAREAELKDRVKELHKSAQFEMEEEMERVKLFVGQLEQYAKGLEEMEASLTLAQTTSTSSSSSSTAFSIPRSLLVDVCLLEASLHASFSHSMKVEVPLKERVEFDVSKEEEGWRERLSGLGRVSLRLSPPLSSFPFSSLPTSGGLSSTNPFSLYQTPPSISSTPSFGSSHSPLPSFTPPPLSSALPFGQPQTAFNLPSPSPPSFNGGTTPPSFFLPSSIPPAPSPFGLSAGRVIRKASRDLPGSKK